MTRTITSGWSPGQPRPASMVVLGTPESTLRQLEDRARWLIDKIVGEYRSIRRWSAEGDTFWPAIARRSIVTDRLELRAVLRARRAVRATVEREEDRVDEASKEWARLRAEGLSEAELREASGR
jgi:hypothetical protein